MIYEPITTDELTKGHEDFLSKVRGDVLAEAEQSIVKSLDERIARESSQQIDLDYEEIPLTFEAFLLKYENTKTKVTRQEENTIQGQV